MEWLGGLPKDLEAIEKAARQVDGLKDVELSDLERLLSRLNDDGWVLRSGYSPFFHRLFGGYRKDIGAIAAAAGQVDDLKDVERSDLKLLLLKLDASGWLLTSRDEARS